VENEKTPKPVSDVEGMFSLKRLAEGLMLKNNRRVMETRKRSRYACIENHALKLWLGVLLKQ
jgi:hypothetical protein